MSTGLCGNGSTPSSQPLGAALDLGSGSLLSRHMSLKKDMVQAQTTIT